MPTEVRSEQLVDHVDRVLQALLASRSTSESVRHRGGRPTDRGPATRSRWSVRERLGTSDNPSGLGRSRGCLLGPGCLGGWPCDRSWPPSALTAACVIASGSAPGTDPRFRPGGTYSHLGNCVDPHSSDSVRSHRIPQGRRGQRPLTTGQQVCSPLSCGPTDHDVVSQPK